MKTLSTSSGTPAKSGGGGAGAAASSAASPSSTITTISTTNGNNGGKKSSSVVSNNNNNQNKNNNNIIVSVVDLAQQQQQQQQQQKTTTATTVTSQNSGKTTTKTNSSSSSSQSNKKEETRTAKNSNANNNNNNKESSSPTTATTVQDSPPTKSTTTTTTATGGNSGGGGGGGGASASSLSSSPSTVSFFTSASSPIVTAASAAESTPQKRLVSEAEKFHEEQIKKEVANAHKKRIQKAEELIVSRLAALQKLHDDWVRNQKSESSESAQTKIDTLSRNIRSKLKEDKDEADGRFGARIGRMERECAELRRKINDAVNSISSSGGGSDHNNHNNHTNTGGGSPSSSQHHDAFRREIENDTDSKIRTIRDEISAIRARHAKAQEGAISTERDQYNSKLAQAKRDAEEAAQRSEHNDTQRKKQLHGVALSEIDAQTEKEIRGEQERASRAKKSEVESLVNEVQTKCETEIAEIRRKSEQDQKRIADEVEQRVREIAASVVAVVNNNNTNFASSAGGDGGGGAAADVVNIDGGDNVEREALAIMESAQSEATQLDNQCRDQIAELKRKSQDEVKERLRSIAVAERELYLSSASALRHTQSAVIFSPDDNLSEATAALRHHQDREYTTEKINQEAALEELQRELTHLEADKAKAQRNSEYASQQERSFEAQHATEMGRFIEEKLRLYSKLQEEATVKMETARTNDVGEQKKRALDGIRARVELTRESREADLRRGINDQRCRTEKSIEDRILAEVEDRRREIDRRVLPVASRNGGSGSDSGSGGVPKPRTLPPPPRPRNGNNKQKKDQNNNSAKTKSKQQQEEQEAQMLESILTGLQEQFRQAEREIVVASFVIISSSNCSTFGVITITSTKTTTK